MLDIEDGHPAFRASGSPLRGEPGMEHTYHEPTIRPLPSERGARGTGWITRP